MAARVKAKKAARKTTKKAKADLKVQAPEAKPKRRRTGEAKRKARRAQGNPLPPDETKIRTPQDAQRFWERQGAWELSRGLTFRVARPVDLAAFPDILQEIRKKPKAYSDRLLPSVLVEGAVLLAAELERAVAGEPPPELPATDADVLVMAGRVGSMRESIKRLEAGRKNLAIRHAFGTDLRIEPWKPATVLAAVQALLTGRRSKPRTTAARSLIEADVKTLLEAEKALSARVTVDTKLERNEKVEHSRTDALHAGLQLFYDRFGAAATRIYEDDGIARVRVLSLIPRRPEARAKAKAEEETPTEAPKDSKAGDAPQDKPATAPTASGSPPPAASPAPPAG